MLEGFFPAAGHRANAGGERGTSVSACRRLYFGHQPSYPAGHGADPRGGAPLGAMGAKLAFIPHPKRKSTDPALGSRVAQPC